MLLGLTSFSRPFVKLRFVNYSGMQIFGNTLRMHILGSTNSCIFYSHITEGPLIKRVSKVRKNVKLSTDIINVSEEETYETNEKVIRLHPSKLNESILLREDSMGSLNFQAASKLDDTHNDCEDISNIQHYQEYSNFLDNANPLLEYETLNKENLILGVEDSPISNEDDFIVPDSFPTYSEMSEFRLGSLNNYHESDPGNIVKNKPKKKRIDKINVKEKLKRKIYLDNNLVERFKDLRKEVRIRMQNDSLSSMISVCFNVGLGHEAMLEFHQYCNSLKPDKNLALLDDISVYNAVLKCLANDKPYSAMKPILHTLKNSSLKPDYNTFASILCCLGKSTSENQEYVEETLKWMETEGVDIQSVMHKAMYIGDSKEYAYKAIEVVRPDIRELCVISSSSKEFHESICYRNDLVDSLNHSVFSRKLNSPLKGLVSIDDMKKFLESQILAEIDGVVEIKNIKKNEITPELLRCRKQIMEWDKEWRVSVKEAFLMQRDFYKTSFYGKGDKRMELYPYLISLDPDEFVDLMIMEVHNLSLGSQWYSLPHHVLATNVGQRVFNRYLIKYQMETGLHDKLRDVYCQYHDWYLNRSDPDQSYIPRIQWEKILNNMGTNSFQLFDSPPDWPYYIKKTLGLMLYNIMIMKVSISTTVKGESYPVPALYKVKRNYTEGSIDVKSEVKPSPLLTEVVVSAALPILRFATNTMPMTVPPLPWTNINSGGYLFTRANFIRPMRYGKQQLNQLEACGRGELFPVMDSLNQLGSMPWRINTKILDLIIKIFNRGGWSEMDIPSLLNDANKPPPINYDMKMDEKNSIRNAITEHEKLQNESYSIWCNALYKLSIANHYRDCISWLPHNLDFRGRIYPLPTHLSHITNDVFRSTMLFANGKPLGQDGLNWLKIHLINLTGIKKHCSIQERLDYCNEILEKIMDSADNPDEGEKWWTKVDEPWQCLAACMELTAALRSSSPEDFVSHLPIHQDGSCNGLQHYAALGRDKVGAKSVNLSPGIVPQDVYSDVVALVEKQRRRDAKNGMPVAKYLEGYVSRKVIKQTVMTTVYGVTRYGAKLQIAKQLKNFEDVPREVIFQGSSYLSRITFDSLGKMFTSTKNIQDWFVKCVDGITKVCLQNVDWVTPLGFPVVQPYSKLIKSSSVPKRLLNNLAIDGNSDAFLQPLVMKQKNAFPPNFIHSLDSSHMMLTSLYSQHAGISFVSVHDCFWTHASTVDVMNKICREQFVALHSQPILNNLSKHFLDRYGKDDPAKTIPYTLLNIPNEQDEMSNLRAVIVAVPIRGKFNINEVLDSVFFFS